MGYTGCLLWFRHGHDVKGLLAELLFGNIGVEIPTYVRNDNYKILQQVEPMKTVSGEKDRMGFSKVIGKN